MEIVSVTKGAGPLVLSMPHGGMEIPEDLKPQFNALGLLVSDTDWWIPQLYNFGSEFDATVVQANISRYVVDLNRDPSGSSLYPGQATTGLCPTETFDGDGIYKPGMEPDQSEIKQRRAPYFDPYHQALKAALLEAKETHGYALLYDCHSIRSKVPRLFGGKLPVINIGTNEGASCSPALEEAVVRTCVEQDDFTFVANGRFKGGWITRTYGRPVDHVHAVQVELAQSAYMLEKPPWTFDEERAVDLRGQLRFMIRAMTRWAATNQATSA